MIVEAGEVEAHGIAHFNHVACCSFCVVGHDIGKHGRHAEAVRRVGEGAGRVLHGVSRSGAGRSERTAGGQSAHHDVGSRVLVGVRAAGLFETAAEQLYREKCEVIGQSALADEDMILREFRARFLADRGIGLDRMGESIRARDCCQPARAGHGQFRIADSDLRNQMRAGDANLERPVGIGNDGDRSGLRSRSGGGGYGDQRNGRARYLELAVIVGERAAMGHQEGSAFGEVEAAAAADSDDHVGPVVSHGVHAIGNGIPRHILLDAVVDAQFDAGSFQPRFHLRKYVGARKALVGADQRCPAELARDGRQGMALAFAEENFTGKAQGGKQGHWICPMKRGDWCSADRALSSSQSRSSISNPLWRDVSLRFQAPSPGT